MSQSNNERNATNIFLWKPVHFSNFFSFGLSIFPPSFFVTFLPTETNKNYMKKLLKFLLLRQNLLRTFLHLQLEWQTERRSFWQTKEGKTCVLSVVCDVCVCDFTVFRWGMCCGVVRYEWFVYWCVWNDLPLSSVFKYVNSKHISKFINGQII